MLQTLPMLKNYLSTSLILCITLLTPLYAYAIDKNIEVFSHKGKHSIYYHMAFTLNNSNFDFSKDEENKPYYSYTVQDLKDAGGQFEIIIPVDKFPITSLNCKNDIILRMPWSDLNNSKGISGKIDLFNSLKEIKTLTKDKIDVTLELNPYVKADSKANHGVVLTSCNVFFRHARGVYINDVK